MKYLLLGIFIGTILVTIGGGITLSIKLRAKLKTERDFEKQLSQVLRNTYGIGNKLHDSIMATARGNIGEDE